MITQHHAKQPIQCESSHKCIFRKHTWEWKEFPAVAAIAASGWPLNLHIEEKVEIVSRNNFDFGPCWSDLWSSIYVYLRVEATGVCWILSDMCWNIAERGAGSGVIPNCRISQSFHQNTHFTGLGYVFFGWNKAILNETFFILRNKVMLLLLWGWFSSLWNDDEN